MDASLTIVMLTNMAGDVTWKEEEAGGYGPSANVAFWLVDHPDCSVKTTETLTHPEQNINS